MENQSNLLGRRIQIAGSASETADPLILQDVHCFVNNIVKRVLSLGGGLSVTAGGEPISSDGIPLIFDWTVIASIVDFFRNNSSKWPNHERKPVSALVYARFKDKIPEQRIALWKEFINSKHIELTKQLSIEENVGEILRKEQSVDGDILITIGGNEGTHRLAALYQEKRKSIIPLEFKVGKPASLSLAEKAKSNPNKFFLCQNPAHANLMFNQLQYDEKGTKNELIDNIIYIAEGILKLQDHKADLIKGFILNELIRAAITLQQRQIMIRRGEDNYSGFLVELLNPALNVQGLYASEQKPSGKSFNAKNVKGEIGGIGELDFEVVNVSTRDLVTICEAMIINDCNHDKVKIGTHLNKIFTYDLTGLPYNFFITYVREKNFFESWNKYWNLISQINYTYPLIEIKPILKNVNSNIKIISTSHLREGVVVILIHIFLKFE